MRRVAGTTPGRGGLRNHALLLRKRMCNHGVLGISFKMFGHFIMMWIVSGVVVLTENKTWELWFPLWFLFISRWWVLSFWFFIVIIFLVFLFVILLPMDFCEGED
jgi:hypothetical protein